MDHYWCTLSSVIQLSSVAMRLTNCQRCIAHIQNHTAENRWSTMGGLMILETLGAFVDCPHRCLTLGAAIVALPWRSYTVETNCFLLRCSVLLQECMEAKQLIDESTMKMHEHSYLTPTKEVDLVRWLLLPLIMRAGTTEHARRTKDSSKSAWLLCFMSVAILTGEVIWCAILPNPDWWWAYEHQLVSIHDQHI